jgi:hypothetical protein
MTYGSGGRGDATHLAAGELLLDLSCADDGIGHRLHLTPCWGLLA